MFSKALFKQSCKANGVLWAIITFAVCFMLACVMLITGNGSMGGIKTGISNTIITSQIDSQMEDRAINYYELISGATSIYNSAYEQAYAGAKLANPSASEAELEYFATTKAKETIPQYIAGVLNKLNYQEGSVEAQELSALINTALNTDHLYDSFYTMAKQPEKTYSYDHSQKDSAKQYSREVASIFLASSMTDQANVDKVVSALSGYSIDANDYTAFSYTETVDGETQELSRYTGVSGYKFIRSLSIDVLLGYQSKVDYYVSNGIYTEAEAKAKVSGDITKSFLSSLPQEVQSALSEIGEMDLFSLIVGSIFFKMAGLLLPIIYIIMVSNNLIAGQVDSGSMAYILSTSTKRTQVVFTQAVYLIGSLFAMFGLTTITSVVCLKILNNPEITLTYGNLLLLNLGAFLTLFAMSGISFMASCWFNRSKYSMSLGGGINMFFLVSTMLGLFGSKVLPTVVRLKSLNFFNYTSLISLFDVISILDSTTTFIWKFSILIAIGVICYILGGIKFKKKDLPL